VKKLKLTLRLKLGRMNYFNYWMGKQKEELEETIKEYKKFKRDILFLIKEDINSLRRLMDSEIKKLSQSVVIYRWAIEDRYHENNILKISFFVDRELAFGPGAERSTEKAKLEAMFAIAFDQKVVRDRIRSLNEKYGLRLSIWPSTKQ